VTLIAGALERPLDEYAQTYLAGNALVSSRDESRPGARGRFYLFNSPDGKMRHSLLLLEEKAEGRQGVVLATPVPPRSPRPPSSTPPARAAATRPAASPSPTPVATPAPSAFVYGLYAQGDASSFDKQLPLVEEMAKSLTLERPSQYLEERNDKFGFSIRVPSSWRSSRSFSGSGTYLKQFTSPPLGADRRQTVHASLTVTVEPVAGDVDAFYVSTMQKLGDAFTILSHNRWDGGYVDVLQSETPVAVSRGKRFFRAADGRGYSLAFEARDDVYPRVSRWCDLIAATFKIDGEAPPP
jgi:hypothetical protein